MVVIYRPRTLSVSVSIHDRTSVYVGEMRNFWWSSGDRILRTGIVYVRDPKPVGDGKGGVSGTASVGEGLFVEDFLRSRGIKGGMIELLCLAISTA